MASPSITTQFATPDPNEAPLNLAQLFALANRLVSSTFSEAYIPFIIQNGEPGAADRDKVWIERDSQGRPVAIKVWWAGSGSWRRIYNGMLGEIRGYTGNPGTDFDSTGWGRGQGQYDGWHLCNGNDGAPDYSDHFLIGAHMNNADHSGYIGGEWVTWISNDTGQHTGGVRDFTLTEDTTWRPAKESLQLDHFNNTPAMPRNADGHIYGTPDDSTDFSFGGDPGNIDPSSVSVINPFIALGWVIFMGYRT